MKGQVNQMVLGLHPGVAASYQHSFLKETFSLLISSFLICTVEIIIPHS